MRRIFNYNLTLLSTLFFIISCGEEPYNLNDGGEALANLTAPSDRTFLFDETSSIEIGPIETVVNPGITITSVVVKKQLVTVDGNSDIVSYNITGDSFSQTEAELFADVPVNGEVLDESNLAPGDSWEFVYEIVLGDGRTLEPSANTTVLFTCVSDIAGTYTTITDGGQGDGAGGTEDPFSDLEYEVIITEVSPGKYEFSDVTGGLYTEIYGASDNPVEITDVCDQLILDSQPDVVYGGDEFNGTGTVNSDGSLTVSWSNNWGDNGVTVFTPI
ncbi:MAG: hypothetical protein AAF519_04920 [Bacteroidota bacterium]